MLSLVTNCFFILLSLSDVFVSSSFSAFNLSLMAIRPILAVKINIQDERLLSGTDEVPIHLKYIEITVT